MKSEIKCTVIGDAMIDIIFPIINKKNMSCIKMGGVITTNSRLKIGGLTNIANNLNKLGLSSSFIGKVGKDCFGNYFEAELVKYNSYSKISKTEKFNTGIVSAYILPNKERFFVVDRGANQNLLENDIDFDMCRHSKYLYISGYSFQDDHTTNTINHVLKDLSNSNVKIIFNPGAPNLAKTYKKVFKDLIKEHIDILFMNKEEANNLFGKDLENIKDHAQTLALNKIIITKGSEGSRIINEHQIIDIAPHLVENLIDTTGAGDAFASAFIYGMDKGWDDKISGNFAAKYASKIICNYGSS